MAAGQLLQFIQRLWPGEIQGDLPGLVEALVVASQGLLEGRGLQRQAVAIAGLEAAQRMAWRDCLQQGEAPLRLPVPCPGDELGVDHLALASLAFEIQQRLSEHVAQPQQRAIQGARRYLAEEIGVTLRGTGVDLTAQALDVAHQAVRQRETRGAEKQQVFQEVRQPWPARRRIVATGMDAQGCGAALEVRRVAQIQLQAIGEGELAGGARHGISIVLATILAGRRPVSARPSPACTKLMVTPPLSESERPHAEKRSGPHPSRCDPYHWAWSASHDAPRGPVLGREAVTVRLFAVPIDQILGIAIG
ncbi:hypothetical protein SRABI70_01538 [Pseudomonas sp. Bi70]|nr:hypothetical protein SRABI70_01538 [Pseudomonas sp. Bi70]